MKQANFRNWTLTTLEDTFGLKQIWNCKLLEKWENNTLEVSEREKENLLMLQRSLIRGGKAWNEAELENKFISPVMMQAQIDDDEIGCFLERSLSATINNYELSGIVDGMISKGFRDPKTPYFCMHEYQAPQSPKGKKEESPPLWGDSGATDAQALIAMLVARELNENKKPIYGLYVVGVLWNFMVLNGNEYCISKSYTTDDENIFLVFKMLKDLKNIIKTELL